MLVEKNFFQTYSNNPPQKPQNETAELKKLKQTTKIRNQNRQAKPTRTQLWSKNSNNNNKQKQAKTSRSPIEFLYSY